MSGYITHKDSIRVRKRKLCCLCGEWIEPGDLKDTRTGVDGDEFWTMHMHPECHAYESMPGTVDMDWYEGGYDPAFHRQDAIDKMTELKK